MDYKKIAPLDQFVNKLLEEKGVGELDSEIMDQLRNDLLSRINDRINAMIIEKLPENKLDEFEKILDSEDINAIQDFLSGNIVNLDEEIAKVLLDFRNIYLA